MIELAGVRIVCEVKQIDPNPEDEAALEELRQRGSAGRYVPNRLRPKLKKVSKQLKTSAEAGQPTLLVIYDNTPFKPYSDHTQVIEAMFGKETVTVYVPVTGRGPTQVSDPYFGGNRGLTPWHNTSVSAIVMLDGGPEPPPDSLRVYHNPYAAVPIDPNLFDGLPVTQPLLPGATKARL